MPVSVVELGSIHRRMDSPERELHKVHVANVFPRVVKAVELSIVMVDCLVREGALNNPRPSWAED